MLLLERGKQVISNETKGGQPPFAFLAVISLKTGRSDYNECVESRPFSSKIAFLKADIQGSKTTSCQCPLDLLLRARQIVCVANSLHHTMRQTSIHAPQMLPALSMTQLN